MRSDSLLLVIPNFRLLPVRSHATKTVSGQTKYLPEYCFTCPNITLGTFQISSKNLKNLGHFVPNLAKFKISQVKKACLSKKGGKSGLNCQKECSNNFKFSQIYQSSTSPTVTLTRRFLTDHPGSSLVKPTIDD